MAAVGGAGGGDVGGELGAGERAVGAVGPSRVRGPVACGHRCRNGGHGGVGGQQGLACGGAVGGRELGEIVELVQGQVREGAAGVGGGGGRVRGVGKVAAQAPGEQRGNVVGSGQVAAGEGAGEQTGQVESCAFGVGKGADEGGERVGGEEGRGAVQAEDLLQDAGDAGGGGAVRDVGVLRGQGAGGVGVALEFGARLGGGQLRAAAARDAGQDGVEVLAVVVEGDVQAVGVAAAGDDDVADVRADAAAQGDGAGEVERAALDVPGLGAGRGR
ncbi:hypothetical protein [Actinacidiphila glaucinigra]|uniref:hypothetical protein n=1 Tax=Actinacidiphila glaucinigra TaxID=235986 RepID=UPI003D8F9517